MRNILRITVLTMALSGCATLQNKPALRTALIATGAAVLGGAISHARDNDPRPMKHIPKPPNCHEHECD